MDLGIAGKWALVCGASKGLGYGCALALARAGVNLVIAARGEQTLTEAATNLIAASAYPAGGNSENKPTKTAPTIQVTPLAIDVTTPQGRAAVLATRRDFDIVVSNAGGPPPGDFRAWGRDDWLRAIDANMLTPIEWIKAFADGMAERGFGRIVNITSSAVKAPIDILGLSNGARSGLTGFVAGVARNPGLAARNVTINNLLPGAFDTDRLRTTMQGVANKTQRPLDAVLDERRRTIPAARFGTAQEFGAICAFLCSQHAGYITGQNILADGGAYPGTY